MVNTNLESSDQKKYFQMKIKSTVYWIYNVIECNTRATVEWLTKKNTMTEFHPTNDLYVCVKNQRFH